MLKLLGALVRLSIDAAPGPCPFVFYQGGGS